MKPLLSLLAFLPAVFLAVFFVLAGLRFHLTGVRSGEFARILLSFTAVAAGVLTHYSAVPYAVFLGSHLGEWAWLAALVAGAALCTGLASLAREAGMARPARS